MEIYEAAKQLGRILCGVVPHVVGTAVRRRGKEQKESLFVALDSDDCKVLRVVIPQIPDHYDVYAIHLELYSLPQFA